MVADPTILVIGDSSVGKSTIIRALLECSHESDLSWVIDTRYYTANVIFREVDLGSDVSPQESYEALLLVFSMADESTFDALLRWLRRNQIDLETAPVRVCVANKYDMWAQPGAGTKLDARVRQWCAGHLVEHVPASIDAAALPVDEEDDFGGCTGYARVRQALHAHTWSNMQLKTAEAQQQYIPPKSRAGLLHRSTGSGVGFDDDSYEQPHVGAYEPPTLDCSGASGNGNQEPDGGGFEEDEDWSAFQAALGEEVEDPEEKRLEEFEGVLAKVSGARERLSSLPDDQRRRQAGQLVLQLMAMLGTDDDGDNENSESDVDDDTMKPTTETYNGATDGQLDAAPEPINNLTAKPNPLDPNHVPTG